MNKKMYKIPCTWEMYGVLDIEADSLEDAVKIAEDDGHPLPDHQNYSDGSFVVNFEILKEYNKEAE